MGVGKSKQFPISYEDACKRGEGLSVSKRVHASLAGQTFAARGGEGGARKGGKRTSGHFRQVSVAWRNLKT